MRKSTDHIEKYRVLTGQLASVAADGMNGAFVIPVLGEMIGVIVSNGRDWNESKLPGPKWEHVSASLRKKRLPTWYEMQAIKEIFWEPDELVLQFHVPRQDHIDLNEVLHLWRPIGIEIPLPPKDCV